MKVGRAGGNEREEKISMEVRKRSARCAATAFLVAAFAAGCSGPGTPFVKSRTLGGKRVSARRLNRGHELFVTYCAACHGVDGDGKGPASIGLRPPPRNFTQGQFKFAAVASGQLPNDEDLLRIVQKGLHGSAMLPWNDVPERDILDIIQYIKTLSPKWADKPPGEPALIALAIRALGPTVTAVRLPSLLAAMVTLLASALQDAAMKTWQGTPAHAAAAQAALGHRARCNGLAVQGKYSAQAERDHLAH